VTTAPVKGNATTPPLLWDHLRRLTGRFGLFEHALYDTPRFAHGYTTCDNARALVVLSRAGMHEAALQPYLDFVLAGRLDIGWHNRMSSEGRWLDRVGSDDAAGRAVWGLAEVVAAGHEDERVVSALVGGLGLESRHLRSNVYLLLAAASSHGVGLPQAEHVLRAALGRLPDAGSGTWPWPEPRLTYDNARLPEALIRAGDVLDEPSTVDLGLTLLEWLVDVEWTGDWFSFTPVGGRGPGEAGPGFDQQPIEAWGMVDACRAASEVDPTGPWGSLHQSAARWFLGHNDLAMSLYDADTGAGFDGLTADGANLNRGAESTLAALGAVWSLHEAKPTP
jgi:hypothetical protein